MGLASRRATLQHQMSMMRVMLLVAFLFFVEGHSLRLLQDTDQEDLYNIGTSGCPLSFNETEVSALAQQCSIISTLTSFVTCCEHARTMVRQARGARAVQLAGLPGQLSLNASEASSCQSLLDRMLGAYGANGTTVMRECKLLAGDLLESNAGQCSSYSTLPSIASAMNISDITEPCFGAISMKADDPLAGFPSERACRPCLNALQEGGARLAELADARNATSNSTSACTENLRVGTVAESMANGTELAVSQCLSLSAFRVGTPPSAQDACTAIDWDILDFTAAFLSCGPPQIKNDSCCTVLSGMVGLAVMPYIHTTGNLLLSRIEAKACEDTFIQALDQNGVPASSYLACNLDNVFPQIYSCNNYTTPSEFVNSPLGLSNFETNCGDPTCTENCWLDALKLASKLAGGFSDQLPVISGCLTEAFIVWGSQHVNNLTYVAKTFQCFAHVPPQLVIKPNETTLAIKGPFTAPPIAPKRDKKPPPAATGVSPLTTWGLIGAILGGTLFAVLIVAFVIACLWNRGRKKRHVSKALATKVGSIGQVSLHQYSLSELSAATANFSKSAALGPGGLFRGDVQGGYVVAIKELSSPTNKHEFLVHARFLSALRHPNLAILQGMCTEKKRQFLVYDFAGQSCLCQHLEEGNLTWALRMKIMKGVAWGLAWLHEVGSPPITHSELSPSHLFFDTDYRPQIAGGGLSIFVGKKRHNQPEIAPYFDPNSSQKQQKSPSGDVYSFGIILLEIISGRPPICETLSAEQVSLVNWARALSQDSERTQLADPRLQPLENSTEVQMALQVALLCIDEDASRRPSMGQVARMLDPEAALSPRLAPSGDHPPPRPPLHPPEPSAKSSLPFEAALWAEAPVSADVSLAKQMGQATSNSGTVTGSSGSLVGAQITGWKEVEVAAAPTWDLTRQVESPRSNEASLTQQAISEGRQLLQQMKLEFNQYIGGGSYGRVYRWQHLGTEYAVKVVMGRTEELKELWREVVLLRELRHPNIVQFMFAIANPPGEVYIVTEYLARGNLYQLLHENWVLLSLEQRLQVALDTAKGLAYLHERNVVHRDLKSPNLLVSNDGSVKVCDFGQARLLSGTRLSTKNNGGTIPYMSPESLENFQGHPRESDVFAFGVLFWEIMARKPPWDGYSDYQIIKAVAFDNERLPLDPNWDPRICSMISRCWDKDHTTRPSFEQLVQEIHQLTASIGLQWQSSLGSQGVRGPVSV